MKNEYKGSGLEEGGITEYASFRSKHIESIKKQIQQVFPNYKSPMPDQKNPAETKDKAEDKTSPQQPADDVSKPVIIHIPEGDSQILSEERMAQARAAAQKDNRGGAMFAYQKKQSEEKEEAEGNKIKPIGPRK